MNSGTNTSLEFLTRLTRYSLLQEAAAGVFDEPISRDEVTASIRNLKLGKSAGPDKIVSEMLKYVDQNVADFLVQLFNKLNDEGIFPKEWSKSIIVLIHKKGDANIPDNYRGIALTSVLSKVYTHIFNKRLTGWEEQQEKILEQQAGFRAGYSTIDHIFTLYGLVQKHLQRHTKFYVAFVDLKKAFDSISVSVPPPCYHSTDSCVPLLCSVSG